MLGKRKKQIPERRPVERAGSNAPVFSYYASRSERTTTTGRQERTPHKFDWKLLPSYLALLAILTSLFYVTTLTTHPKIMFSDNKSMVLKDQGAYQSTGQELLSKSIFNRSKLLIDTRELENQLKERFAELRDVSITIPLTSRRPIIFIEPARPLLFMTASRKTYVIDERGVAILQVKSFEGYRDLPVLNDETGIEVNVGNIILPAADAAFISEARRQFLAKQIEIESLTLPAVANELHVRIKGEGYFIKFNLRGDVRLQAGTYVSMKAELAEKNIKPAEYVDVRVEEKAFYK